MILQVPFMFTFSKLGLPVVYLITIILVYAFNEF